MSTVVEQPVAAQNGATTSPVKDEQYSNGDVKPDVKPDVIPQLQQSFPPTESTVNPTVANGAAEGDSSANGQYDARDSGPEPIESEQLRKLFLGGLTPETVEEDLRNHFSKFGSIKDCVVMKEPKTKKSRCFGFITFATSKEVDVAQSNRPHVIHGREVEPKRALPREGEQISEKPGQQASSKKLFVGGLKDEVQEEDLRNYFASYGKINSVTLISDKQSGKRKGFGFVEFDDYDPVDKVLLWSEFQDHQLKDKRINVEKALPKDSEGGRGRRDFGESRSMRDRRSPPRSGGGGGRFGGGGGGDRGGSRFGGGGGGRDRDSYGGGGGGGGRFGDRRGGRDDRRGGGGGGQTDSYYSARYEPQDAAGGYGATAAMGAYGGYPPAYPPAYGASAAMGYPPAAAPAYPGFSAAPSYGSRDPAMAYGSRDTYGGAGGGGGGGGPIRDSSGRNERRGPYSGGGGGGRGGRRF